MPSPRRPVADCCKLLLIALLFFGCGTWSLPLIDRDEPRFAEASREMRQNGDYIVPFFNHAYRFDKPPLIYWAQVAAFNVFGESDFAVRLPSVVAGALTVLVVYGFALSLYGCETAWLSALVALTCLQIFEHSKAAVADMPMVLFFTLAVWAGWQLIDGIQRRPGRGTDWPWWWIFYLALALGFLAKGPVAWLPLAAVWWFAAARRGEGVARRFRFGLGGIVVLAVVGAWGVPALLQTHGAFFAVGIGKQVVARSLTTMEGHGFGGWMGSLLLLPMYFVTVFLSFFPWSIRLPWLVRRLRKGAGEPRSGKRWAWFCRGGALADDTFYLLAGVLVVFGVFTLVRTKLPHYTLPALPLLAILFARELRVEAESHGGARSIDPERWAATTIIVGTAIALLVFPLLPRFVPSRNLVDQSRSVLTPQMEFASAGYEEPSLVWYARNRVRGWYSPMSAGELPAFMARKGPRFCVAPAGTIEPQPGWLVFQTRGFNQVHWEATGLELVVKPD